MFYHISQTLNVFQIFFLEDLSDSFVLHPFLLTLNYKIKNNQLMYFSIYSLLRKSVINIIFC